MLNQESEEVPADWKLTNVVPVFKKEDPRNCRLVSYALVPGKIAKIILGITEKHLKGNTVTANGRYRFVRGKSCLTNVISLYHEVIHLVD